MSADDVTKLLLDLIWSLPESVRPFLGDWLRVAAVTQSYWTGVVIMALAGLVCACVYVYVESWTE